MSFGEIQSEFGQDLSGFMPLVNKNIDFRTDEALEKQISNSTIERDNHRQKEEFKQDFRNDLLLNGRQKQFSKGFDRLHAWLSLAYKYPSQFGVDKYGKPFIVKSLSNPHLDKFAKLYALAGLIVIFQVFGDGNHRTSSEFFKRNTGRELTDEEKNLIENFNRNYSWHGIANNSYPPAVIDEIVESLTSKFIHMNRLRGGKSTKKKIKSRKNKTKKIKSKKSKNKHQKGGNKRKTCWDPNIISPVFFGYPLKKQKI